MSEQLSISGGALAAPPDPLELLASTEAGQPAFYLERPDSGECMVATGVAIEVRTTGAHRFATADLALKEVFVAVERAKMRQSSAAPVSMPRVVGGFSFSDEIGSQLWRDFAPCWFFVPREQWVLDDGSCQYVHVGGTAADADSLTNTNELNGFRVAAGAGDGASCDFDDEPEKDWLGRAHAALAAIEAGTLQKIVVARRKSRALADDLHVVDLLRRLREARPSCYTFCLASRSSVFLGSSPEKLLGVSGLEVEADALAGTIARGATPAADLEHARELAESAKDRREQAAVVAGIRAALASQVSDLDVADAPAVRAFPEGFHLYTRIRGRRSRDASVLDLVAALHPTPAVCGVPREEATDILDRLEADRGWYSGGVGWLDPAGDGMFAVALRAGLLAGGRLTAWAGAGIVAGSNPRNELAEISLKMQPLLSAVEGTAV